MGGDPIFKKVLYMRFFDHEPLSTKQDDEQCQSLEDSTEDILCGQQKARIGERTASSTATAVARLVSHILSSRFVQLCETDE